MRCRETGRHRSPYSEVDIAPSQDYEEAMRRLAEAEAKRLAAAAAAAQERDDKRRKEEETAAAAAAEAARKSAQAAAAAARAERYRAAIASALPPEPDPAVVAGAVACRFTLPDGTTRVRRFAPTDPLQAVFDFVRSVGGAGEGETFRLVTRWPRTVIEAPDSGGVGGDSGGPGATVSSAGLQPSDTFFVERIVE